MIKAALWELLGGRQTRPAGPRTPFFTPVGLLERRFERQGLRTVAAGQVGLGTYYLARRA